MPHVQMPVPTELRTSRLVLRPWRAEDADELLPILEANLEHLGPWIPARVSTPVPLPQLAERLAGFNREFAEAREWRYGMFATDDGRILGEVGLYPRSDTSRAAYADATCVELGYWLGADATGQGLVTEASRLLLAEAAKLPHISHVEIRCDARNAASAAIPKRLGFTLASSVARDTSDGNGTVQMQIWTRDIASLGSLAPS